MRTTIAVGDDIFEVVDHVPLGYQVWNIGKNMPEGYLPLCRAIPGTYRVEVDTLKAIKIDGAQKILAAVHGGQNTIMKMERYIKRYQNAKPGSVAHLRVQRMREALPAMREIKWA